MKAGIHPAYNLLNVICACGSTFQTRSTQKTDLRVEICSACHPFFTGRQKLIDTEGRVDRFNKEGARGGFGLILPRLRRAIKNGEGPVG